MKGFDYMSGYLNGYLASPELQTSSGNHEIVPNKPDRWTNGYRLRKLSFDNVEECTILINDEIEVFLKAGQGFNTDYSDPPIYSFVVQEEGIQFNFIAAY